MGKNYTPSDAKVAALNTRKTVEADRARKTVKKINVQSGSRFDENLMSYALEVYKKSSGTYYLQTCSSLTCPVADILQGSNSSLQHQYTEAAVQAIIALRHNLKFILAANKINDNMVVKEDNVRKTVFVDLEYLKNEKYIVPAEFASHNKVQTLRQPIETTEKGINDTMVNVIEISLKNIENLTKYVENPTPKLLDTKERAFAAANNIIDCLKNGSINLSPFYAEIQNSFTIHTK